MDSQNTDNASISSTEQPQTQTEQEIVSCYDICADCDQENTPDIPTNVNVSNHECIWCQTSWIVERACGVMDQVIISDDDRPPMHGHCGYGCRDCELASDVEMHQQQQN